MINTLYLNIANILMKIYLYVEVLTPKVTIFGDKAYKEVIKIY